MRKLEKKQIKEGASKVLEALIKFANPKGFLKKILMITILFLFSNVNSKTQENSTNSFDYQSIQTENQIYVESVKTKMKSRLIEEVDDYIKKITPDSKLSPEHLVTKCIEYDTDIIFVLSQGLLESHFGTKGKAAKTNSVWNVGTYDDGTIKYWYDDPNESLEPYLKLLNEKYLINITSKGDTIYKDIHHLVEDRGYKNYYGARFASARGYENGMRKLMVKIDMETSISFYQDIINMADEDLLAYFKPKTEIDYNEFYALN